MRRQTIAAALLIQVLLAAGGMADTREGQVEKAMLQWIASDDFSALHSDGRCRDPEKYRVSVIDNFDQKVSLVPEVQTSHGEIIVKLLRSGRPDIEVQTYNTALSRGLALVLQDLKAGGCSDAVLSSTPGSNYTYDQIGSLFSGRVRIRPDNIAIYQGALQQLLRRIAFGGFPSVQWLQQVDVNSVKLRNDARKFVFIEALGHFGMLVILPYGNVDVPYKGKRKSVNLLSLAANAKVFSGLDTEEGRGPKFPYSPLSAGEETAVYPIRECPDPDDPFRARLDINSDGYDEFSFVRGGKIAYRDAGGNLSFAPPAASRKSFQGWLRRISRQSPCRMDEEIVLTAGQYHRLKKACPAEWLHSVGDQTFVWLNSAAHGRFYAFEARCWNRGTLRGTSVIPPAVVQKMLPPKKNSAE
jgi:hypothetical protein